MTFLKTLGFTLIILILSTFFVANGMLGAPLWLLFIIFTAAGFALCGLFREHLVEGLVQRISIIYISGSIITTLSGFFTNIVQDSLKLLSLGPPSGSTTYARVLINLYSERNIPAELFIILIGLFAPVYLLKQFKEKRQVPHREIIWSVICVIIIYALVAWLAYMKRTSGGVQ